MAAAGLGLLVLLWPSLPDKAPGTIADAGSTPLPAPQTSSGYHASASGALAPWGRYTSRKTLNYGSQEGELGMVRNPGETPIGPESFALSADGNILVADLVNHRIVIYQPDGSFLRSIDLPGVNLNDVSTDERGNIFVYDQQRHTLTYCDPSGSLKSQLQLNPADIDTRGYFHVVQGAVYFADAAARDVLVAALDQGGLAHPPADLERRADGIHGRSGRVFSVLGQKGEGLQVRISNEAGTGSAQVFQEAMPDLLSARFAGEDGMGRSYVSLERLVNDQVVLEALAFDPAGRPLGAIRLDENDYSIWTSKLVEASQDGTIVQFLPEEQQARLNLISEK